MNFLGLNKQNVKKCFMIYILLSIQRIMYLCISKSKILESTLNIFKTVAKLVRKPSGEYDFNSTNLVIKVKVENFHN